MDTLFLLVPWPWLVGGTYIFIISVITFLVFATDKSFAVAGAERTRERTLLVLTLIGGTLGALVAMNQFRHKTKKVSFLSKFGLIVLVQIAVVCLAWYTNTLLSG